MDLTKLCRRVKRWALGVGVERLDEENHGGTCEDKRGQHPRVNKTSAPVHHGWDIDASTDSTRAERFLTGELTV